MDSSSAMGGVLQGSRFASIGEAWLTWMESILEFGEWTVDDGVALKELRHGYARIDSYGMDAILQRLADPSRIELMLEKYSSLAPVPPYSISYGSMFYDADGVNQIEWVITRLKKNPHAKSATLTFHGPGQSILPCISLLDFKLRHNRLETYCVYRSQNMLASHPGNLLAIGKIVAEIAEELDVIPGPIYLNVASAHIYDSDLAAAEEIVRLGRGGERGLSDDSSFGKSEEGTTSPVQVARPTTADLAAEWDVLAPHRHEAIDQGKDISYDHVLVPGLLSALKPYLGRESSVLDAGCGSGAFANHVAERFGGCKVLGLDPSAVSIEIARDRSWVMDPKRLGFMCSSLEDYARDFSAKKFDAVVGNMLLQNVADLDGALNSARTVLREGGVMAFAIIHPCFWPSYWGYDRESWFDYWREIWIKAPFKTTLMTETSATTHVHRPLSRYVSSMTLNGFRLISLEEPRPNPEAMRLYRRPWDLPRFLIGVGRAV